ncbi:unnamed protein product [Meloidogyne enterolobii]|uniref:Uncharacterized protein n=1 Tax=Meloidogyne enterolobii TaxID=390850 RepID=A0ACB1B0J7_MELEN
MFSSNSPLPTCFCHVFLCFSIFSNLFKHVGSRLSCFYNFLYHVFPPRLSYNIVFIFSPKLFKNIRMQSDLSFLFIFLLINFFYVCRPFTSK